MPHVSIAQFVSFGQESEFEPLALPRPLQANGRIIVEAESIRACAKLAFSRIAYRMPDSQLASFSAILESPKSSANETFVAASLLENARIAANGTYPICQDTGTALVYGWRGDQVDIVPDEEIEPLLAWGIAEAYAQEGLRNSQLGPISMIEERNTRDNLPAGIQIRSVRGNSLALVFVAKGGGSTSRTSLTMESPAILRPDRLEETLRRRIQSLGPSGCPPYTIAMVLGGTSPSETLYAAELAALGLLDNLPQSSVGDGSPLRDRFWEEKMLEIAKKSGIGAQWGGVHLAATTRAIRLSRHAANLPLAVAVSCAANRHIAAIAGPKGWAIQKLDHFARDSYPSFETLTKNILESAPHIELSQNSQDWLSRLRSFDAGTIVTLSGPVIVARDAAHARLLKMLEQEKHLPDWFLGLPVFYAGPTEAKPGHATGAFGPTTASRMDSYLEPFMKAGGSIVTIAKGNRSAEAKKAIIAYQGVYCAAIGGAAALNAAYYIRALGIIQFEDLGMEAVRIATLDRLPVIIAVDARGNDIYNRE